MKHRFHQVNGLFMVFLLGMVSFAIGGSNLDLEPISGVPDGNRLLVPESSVRRPVAVEFTADSKHILVANRDSGTICVIEIASEQLVTEKKIGGRLTDLCRISGKEFLAIDWERHQLSCFEFESNPVELRLRWRREVVHYPNRLCFDGQRRVLVGGEWSQQVQVINLDDPQGESEPIDLPFAPGSILWSSEHASFVIAAKFTNQLVVLKNAGKNGWQLGRPKTIDGFSIRSMAPNPDGDSLLLSGQALNELARSTRNDVHWGLMMANELRSITWKELFAEPGNASDALRFKSFAIGRDEAGKGDPGKLRFLKDGTLMVLIEGTGQLAIRPADATSPTHHERFVYLDVGKRPFDLAVAAIDGLGVVANMFDDSICLVRWKPSDARNALATTIRLGSPATLNLVQKGEILFFDASLSHDSWLSCQSCHVDGHTNGLKNDNLSDQNFGAPKLVITALGREGTEPFAWNGSAKSLPEQVQKSIANTLQSDAKPVQSEVEQIAAYLAFRTAAPSLAKSRQWAKRKPGHLERIKKGAELFSSLNCQQCHAGGKLTKKTSENIGLTDELGAKIFNPPSLSGVSQRPRLLHDGRAESLRQLFEHHRHQLGRELSEKELDRLVEFLQTL